MSFNPESIVPPGANIKVIGIGGGGCNAVSTMIRSHVEGVEFITVNTDIQALRFALAPKKIQIGKELTKGLGAGADPDIGRDAALEDRHEIQESLVGADMVFITAGMGGGTGTGGASVIAQIAREMGALTVGVVTKPFNFEGKRRRNYAEMGVTRLRECVDTLITIPNQRLLEVATPDLSLVDAFKMADNVLVNAVKGISDIINIPGTINVDFADVKTVMAGMGLALMGVGSAKGENRAVRAAEEAISSPLLEDVDIEGATGLLINITAGPQVSLIEINEACTIIQDAAHEDANIIFGAVIDENCADEIRVTVIATGFPAEYEEKKPLLSSTKSSAYFNEPGTTIASSRPGATAKLPYNPPKPRPIIAKPQVTPKVSPQVQKPGASAFEGTTTTNVIAPIVNNVAENQAPAVEKISFNLSPEEESIDEPSPVISPVAEAHDLAKWTMGDNIVAEPSAIPLTPEPIIEEIPVKAEKPDENNSAIAEPVIEEDISVAENKEESFFNSPISEMENSYSDYKFDLSEIVDENAASKEPESPRPMEALFNLSEDEPQNAFEEKINEALELAERLQQESGSGSSNSEDENLDIPAFLRNGMKDLSLD